MPPFISRSLLIFALPFVFADVEFTAPAAGAEIAAGTINVAWKENGVRPYIEELTQYTLALNVGGNDDDWLPLDYPVNPGYYSTGYSVSFTIIPELCAPVTNGFFLSIRSTTSSGGWIENFSSRFTITGLNGTIGSEYLNAAKALDGHTSGPSRTGNVVALTSGSVQGSSSTVASTTTTTSSTPQIITVTSGAKSTSTTPAHSASNSSGLAMGAIVGIVVGVLAAASVIIALILWVLVRARRRKPGSRAPDDINGLDDRVTSKQLSVTTLSELSAEGRVTEMGDGIPPPEMDAVTTVRAELEGDTYQPTRPRSEDTSMWDRTPLTPVARSVFEGTLENPLDFYTTPTTPTSRF